MAQGKKGTSEYASEAERRAAKRPKQAEYRQSPAGRESASEGKKRFLATPEGREADRAAKRRYNASDKGKAVSDRQNEKKRAERAAAGGTHGGARPHPPRSTPMHTVSRRPKVRTALGQVRPVPNSPAANRARIAASQAREAEATARRSERSERGAETTKQRRLLGIAVGEVYEGDAPGRVTHGRQMFAPIKDWGRR